MAENAKPNYQDGFLSDLKRTGTRVTVHIINGYQLNHLTIMGYDSFVVMAKSGDKPIMIYKHAISTITPEDGGEEKKNDK